ncbi:MAG: PAS domain S-box protein [Syntrophales bacterium]|nr:PAS domain S-box protein [Syntrophales bacterium]
MDDKPLYNSRVIITYLEYLRHTHPDVDIGKLLTDSGISSYEVEDEGHWLTQRQVDSFHDVLMKRIHDPSISRNAGRYMAKASSQSVSAIRQFVMGFLTPIQAYIMLGKIASYINRGATFQVKKLSRNKVEIITKPNNGVNEKLFQCENRMGSLEAVVMPFIGKLPVLEHPVCVHRGGDYCQYIVSWEEPEFSKWRRIRNYLLIPFTLIMFISCLFLSLLPLIVLGSLFTGVIMSISCHALSIEKKDAYARIEMQGDAANRLLDQITIGYNNALLVQEIGQAVSSILDIDQLLKFVMETLQKRLDFDRGMIMLANRDKTRLIYECGYGYSPELEIILRETQFHLDNPKSKGPLVVAFKQQEPFLINDVSEVQSDISSRSLDFVGTLGVSSFICVPIVYEGKSEGILAVDNYRSRRPHNQSEVSLLMGIAPQIAISINNAKSLRQIMENEERFRALSENAPDIIYTTDNRGIVTYINPAAKEIMGYEKEEVIGKRFTEFIGADDAGTLMQAFDRVKQFRETIKDFEGKLLAKDGSVRLFNMSGAPNFNAAGEITGVVGTLKDFTEFRKLEVQLHHAEKMNALGRLTGGISHDFNNILQAISAYNQLLTMKKTEADPDWKYLTNIQGLTKRATDLVNQLLIFSRKVESKLVPIDINVEIRNYYELLINTLPKTITMTLDLADDLHVINGDTAQLGQVIMNLAVNAKDAMPEGGELSIRTKNIEFAKPLTRGEAHIDAGHYILFRISDTGFGIEKEDLDHIFDPFFTTKEAGKGTGIGLSVVYGIVENHGGYIFCTSEPGKGATFELYLPVSDGMIVEEKREKETKHDLSKGHETILLVDDEPSLLDTGEELLSFLGYHVLTATSGESALAIIDRERERIGLVILDLMMPGMGGAKCLVEILKIVPSMKVMIASGYTASVKKEDILTNGAVAFIQKPYYIEDINKKIREIFKDAGPSR